MRPHYFLLLLTMLAPLCGSVLAEETGDFKSPPAALRPMPVWWLNSTLTPNKIKSQLLESRDMAGFGGVAPLPMANTLPKYLSDDYFARYGDILNAAREFGMEVILRDDDGASSGSAGGRLERLYPDDTMKLLEMAEAHVQGPVEYSRALPPGALMGAVAMNMQTLERIDITSSVAKGKLVWKAPAGTWRVMIFACAKAGNNLVDFLSPESVDKFITLTYDEYFKRLADHFGTTIKRNLFSDVGFSGQTRPWTPAFNEKFQKKFGISPVLFYPALWYDIGSDTEAARVAMFGFLADLMSEGYPACVGLWCHAHGLQNSGQPSAGYELNPVDLFGDPFKFYRHVDIPQVDAKSTHANGRSGFKLISSVATVYDRPLVAAEEFSGFAEKTFDRTMLYRSGMEQFVRGVNRVIPHGMWLDPQHVGRPPLISPFSTKLLHALPDYSGWVGRSCQLLQGGRPVVDIAMLYPIASLEAYYNFGLPDKLHWGWGRYAPPEADYQRVGDVLTCHVRRDFTFLHPGELETQCKQQSVGQDATLHLNNATNWQDYRVLIIPGGKVIPWACLKKIKEFYDNGGRVVSTTCLPEKSAELGHDADVRAAVDAMFGQGRSSSSSVSGLPLHIRIEVAGDTINTFVNGALVDVRADATFLHGGIGFREAEHESATFANVKVTAPDGRVLFSDDFRGDLGQWLNIGNASVRDGELTVKEKQAMRSRVGSTWDDYAFDVDIMTKDGAAGIEFRTLDENNCHMWQFRPADHQFIPYKKINAKWQGLPAVNFPDTDFSTTAFQTTTNPNGGKAYFAAHPTVGTLQAILDDAQPVPDVAFDQNLRVSRGNGFLSYLHKQKDGRDIYYFANSSDDPVDTFVRLRGEFTPQWWDPHTGEKSSAEFTRAQDHGQPVTILHLKLAPVTSIFAVAP